MDFLPLAFLMGLFGSLHCAVMCGPIMLSFPMGKTRNLHSVFQLFLYQLGRILIYTLLGFGVGLVGSTIRIFSDQRMLSIGVGVLLLLFALLQFREHYRNQFSIWQSNFFSPLGKLMARVYNKPYWGFVAGLINGLVPCGMVYLALSTALNTSNIQSAATFMFLFGLGTAPLMLMISLGGVYLKKYIRFNTQKLVPWFMAFIGLVFILRAAELGIPFLSPHTTNSFGAAGLCR